MKKILLVMALAFILPNASPAMADGHGKEANKHYREMDREDRKFYEEQEREERRFREEQEREARKFYERQGREERKHRKKMEKEARKRAKERRKHREDGNRRRVEKGQYLDDDIFVEVQPVPGDVRVALPPLPPGVSYKQIEGDIIKIDDVNRKILDVLEKTGLPLPPIPPLPGLK